MRACRLSLITISLTVSFGAALLPQVPAADEAWSRFRGPNGSGVLETTAIPTEFGPTQNMIWRTPLSPGHSSPVLAEGRIFLTAFENDTLLTVCLDRKSGSVLWRREAPRTRALYVDKRNGPASSTPVTDGRAVYVFFQDFGLIAYDLNGRERWRVPLGPFTNSYGMAASPIVVDEKVILVCDQSVGSFMIAVEAHDGRVVWRIERPEAKTGHSTPVLYRPKGGATELIVPGSLFLTAYSVKTGQRLWWVSGLAFEMKATPVVGLDTIYINGTSSNDFQDSYNRAIPTFDQLAPKYDVDADGRFSPTEIPDELASGKVPVLKSDGTLESLAVNELDEMCYATPAIADGRIYVRTWNALYSFGRR
jgi:outer membrane protein assembly factor BamB